MAFYCMFVIIVRPLNPAKRPPTTYNLSGCIDNCENYFEVLRLARMIVDVQGCPTECQGAGSQAEDDGKGQGVETHFLFLSN